MELMQVQGCKPDSVTYSALITTLERGGQWRRTLKAFEAMQVAGCHPDASVFNSLMEVLWQSGVVVAQVRALQLWSAANRNGHFRCETVCPGCTGSFHARLFNTGVVDGAER